MIENWKIVPGIKELAVSNKGRVKRRRFLKTGVIKEYLLTLYFHDGYAFVDYWVGGKRQLRAVHRLMLMAFDRRPFRGEVARHLDDNPSNISLDNLAWGSRSDNGKDMVRNGKSWKGKKLSIEHRRKLSEAHKGQRMSAATKKALRKANLGRILSPEHRAKIAVAHLGKKASEETRKRLSESHKGIRPSAATRKKLSTARTGVIFSEERCRKISETKKRRNAERRASL